MINDVASMRLKYSVQPNISLLIYYRTKSRNSVQKSSNPRRRRSVLLIFGKKNRARSKNVGNPTRANVIMPVWMRNGENKMCKKINMKINMKICKKINMKINKYENKYAKIKYYRARYDTRQQIRITTMFRCARRSKCTRVTRNAVNFPLPHKLAHSCRIKLTVRAWPRYPYVDG